MTPTNVFNNLNEVVQFIFNSSSQLIVLIFSQTILSIFFAIFIVRKISKLLQKIR